MGLTCCYIKNISMCVSLNKMKVIDNDTRLHSMFHFALVIYEHTMASNIQVLSNLEMMKFL